METPSVLSDLGSFAPATLTAVGRKSQNAQGVSFTCPALILPGHHAIAGTRRPPSYRLRLKPRQGPLLLKNSSWWPPFDPIAPLSLAKKISVLRSAPVC